MKSAIHKSVALAAMLFGAFTMQAALADDAGGMQAPADIYIMAGYTNEDGFVVEVPSIDPQLLAGQLRKLRDELLLRRAELVTEIEDLALDGTDAVLTILLPGGLLYAGYRKHEYELARHRLVEVDAEIDELARDLTNFRVTLGAVAIHTTD